MAGRSVPLFLGHAGGDSDASSELDGVEFPPEIHTANHPRRERLANPVRRVFVKRAPAGAKFELKKMP
jgi:hypothetical protein